MSLYTSEKLREITKLAREGNASAPPTETPAALRALADELSQSMRTAHDGYERNAAELRARADELERDEKRASLAAKPCVCGHARDTHMRCSDGHRCLSPHCACRDFMLAKSDAELERAAPPSDRAETHEPGPLTWKTFGKVGLFSESTKGIVLVSDGRILTPNADTSALREVRADDPSARLLAAAYTSYDRHFGAGAVEAAEADQLGEALAALRELLDIDPTAQPMAFHRAAEKARAILARATGAKP